jgi:transcriptional regulator NrdR family protein
MKSLSLSQEKDLKQASRESKTAHELAVVKRNGTMVPFRKERIYRAIELAFRDTKRFEVRKFFLKT